MSSLSQKKCVACEGTVPPATPEQVEILLQEVPGWALRQAQDDKGEEYPQIVREFEFKDFKQALGFVNKVGELAESEGHHPNIYLHNWNQVKIELYTHTIKGLHENDFIMAAKISQVLK